VHVSRVAVRLAVPAVSALAACERSSPTRPTETDVAVTMTAQHARSPDAGRDAAASEEADPAFLALAQSAREAAFALASTCTLGYQGEHTRVDHCRWGQKEADAVRVAALALHADGGSAALGGPGKVFVEEMRLFSEWIELTREISTRGTLAHYQTLARAWNVWQAGDQVPVDLAKNAYEAEHFPGDRVWRRCASGPCLVLDERLGASP
jgi:hypothetical protein